MRIEDIRKVETCLGTKMPDYYKSFLLNYPYKLTRSGLGLKPDEIYSPESSQLLNDSDKLIEVNRNLRDSVQYWDNENIIVGIDWCGDFFFLDLTVPISPVYYYDHETDESELFSESIEEFAEHVYQIFKDLQEN